MPNTEKLLKDQNKKFLSRVFLLISLLLFISAWVISFWAQNFIECSSTMSAEKGVSASDIHWCQVTKSLYSSDYIYTGYSKAGLFLIGFFVMSKFFLIIGFIFFIIFGILIIKPFNKNSEQSQQENTEL